MPIIGVEILKTKDERAMQKQTKEKQTKTERSKGNKSYSKRMRAKWFCCAFKLSFLQLIYQASLTFKSNLQWKHVAVKCRCLKIWDLKSFLISSSIIVLKWRKLYNNAIEEIISDTSKFQKLNEDPTLKREASLQRFLCKLKQKQKINEIEYDKLYPSAISYKIFETSSRFHEK